MKAKKHSKRIYFLTFLNIRNTDNGSFLPLASASDLGADQHHRIAGHPRNGN